MTGRHLPRHDPLPPLHLYPVAHTTKGCRLDYRKSNEKTLFRILGRIGKHASRLDDHFSALEYLIPLLVPIATSTCIKSACGETSRPQSG